MLVIAPATANTIVKMANGIADNLLTSLYLALADSRVIIFPAMNTKMWENGRTQASLIILQNKINHKIVPPEVGLLACGDVGMGKLPSVRKIVEEIEAHKRLK